MIDRTPRPLLNFVGSLIDLWIRYPNGRVNVVGRVRKINSADHVGGCFLCIGESYVHAHAMVAPDSGGESWVWECEDIDEPKLKLHDYQREMIASLPDNAVLAFELNVKPGDFKVDPLKLRDPVKLPNAHLHTDEAVRLSQNEATRNADLLARAESGDFDDAGNAWPNEREIELQAIRDDLGLE